VLVAIGAAVMPRVAAAMPIDEPDIMVPHRKAPLIDNVGMTIDLDEPGMSIGDFARATMYYPGGCAEWHLAEGMVITTGTMAPDCKVTFHGNDYDWPDDAAAGVTGYWV